MLKSTGRNCLASPSTRALSQGAYCLASTSAGRFASSVARTVSWPRNRSISCCLGVDQRSDADALVLASSLLEFQPHLPGVYLYEMQPEIKLPSRIQQGRCFPRAVMHPERLQSRRAAASSQVWIEVWIELRMSMPKFLLSRPQRAAACVTVSVSMPRTTPWPGFWPIASATVQASCVD